MLKRQNWDYEISPKIILKGTQESVTITPLAKHADFAEEKYLIQIIPMNQSREPIYDYDMSWEKVKSDGSIKFSYKFMQEQEYYIRLFREEDIRPDQPKLEDRYDKNNAFLTLGVYALEEDLYNLTPYKGDFHSHSHRSDGHDAPEVVAANYRKNGFDFFALTDHHKYEPSIEAIEFYKDAPIDLLIVPGEEVHAKDNHVHIVNFGGEWSVNSLIRADEEDYDKQVKQRLSEMDVPEGMTDYNAYGYASSSWVFKKIKESGGLSIYAHPYWLADAYHVPDILGNAIYKDLEFDAFELLGGHPQMPNNIQLAYYNEMAIDGYKRPVVGSSDSHDSEETAEWFNWTFSVVFADNLKTHSIQKAVKDYYSVAVENYPNEAYRVHGSYRLVLYTHFLLSEYFPFHHELCFEEGRLMKDMVQQDKSAVKALGELKGRTNELWLKQKRQRKE